MQWCFIMYVTERTFRAEDNSELIQILIKIFRVIQEIILEDTNFCTVGSEAGYTINFFSSRNCNCQTFSHDSRDMQAFLILMTIELYRVSCFYVFPS